MTTTNAQIAAAAEHLASLRKAGHETALRGLLAESLTPTLADATAAHRDAPWLHVETAHRASLKALLYGAACARCTVKLAFYRRDQSLRYMLCVPIINADPTAKYVTVKDLELSEAAGEPVYRRVNLDAITGAEVSYRASTGA